MPLLLSSCGLDRYLAEDEYLLNKAKVQGEPSEYTEEMQLLINPKPNSRFLGLSRVRMRTYIFADNDRQRGLKAFLRDRVGEKPTLLDSTALVFSARQMENFLFNKGYFDNDVTYRVCYPGQKRLKGNVSFCVQTGPRYTLGDIQYYIQDRLIDSLVRVQQDESLLRVGMPFSSDLLAEERERLTRYLRNEGYYSFNREYIYYEVPVDTADPGDLQVDLGVGITAREGYQPHRKFYINRIYVEPNFRLLDTLPKDTFQVNGYWFLANDPVLDPDVLKEFIYFEPGQLYQIQNEELTLEQLGELGLFKFIDIKVERLEGQIDSSLLNVHIRLTPYKKYEFLADLEVNTTEEKRQIVESARFYGLAGSLTLRNKNLFGQGIQNDWRVLAGLEYELEDIENNLLLGNYELGISTGLTFPRLLFPGLSWQAVPGSRSWTSLNLSFLLEGNEYFRRSTGSFNWSYQLNRNRLIWLINPLELSLVNTDRTAEFDALLDDLNDPLITNLFDRHFILGSEVTFIYTTRTTPLRNYWYFKVTPYDPAGNTLWLFHKLIGAEEPPDVPGRINTYEVGGVGFYQYYKTSLDARYYWVLNGANTIAFRWNGGVGVPYGNSKVLPYERRFFVGGSNSVRAWRSGELGPGSYLSRDELDQAGEILLEGSVEYRFDMGDLFEGALFTDYGNIWTLDDESRPGSVFTFPGFVNDVAVGAGVGLRLDFDFFIFRLDLAFPVRSPYSGWTFEGGGWLDPRLSFGIGYPF